MLAFCNDELRRRELPLNVVELWFAKLAPLNFSFQPFLSDVEMKRALGFRSDRDAARFITRHGILRQILAAYTGVSPSVLSFTCSQLGKPALDGFCQIRFNMSHSGDLAIYAIARERDVGVDIEHRRQAPPEFPDIARLFFSDSEIAVLNATPADHKSDMFLNLWTQIEAKGKACGSGIANLNPRWNALHPFPGKCFGFTTRGREPDYILAVAVQGWSRCSFRVLEFHVPHTFSSKQLRRPEV